MERAAFKMTLKAGCAEEYKRRHDAIWPEMLEELKKAGIFDYSIYLDEETHTLFACQKQQANNTAGELPQKKIVRRWWDYMKDLMETNADGSPVVTPLEDMFYME